jgi:calcium/calmodulin-dependent protein kinase I
MSLQVTPWIFCLALFSDCPVTGYTPFDRDTQQQEMQAIIAGDYKFEPRALF